MVYSSPNAYINKSHASYARSAYNPVNYGLVFVLAMIGGVVLSMLTGGPKPSAEERKVPEGFQRYFGFKPALRYTPLPLLAVCSPFMGRAWQGAARQGI